MGLEFHHHPALGKERSLSSLLLAVSLCLSYLFSSVFVYSREGPRLDPDALNRCSSSSSSSPVVSFRPLTCTTDFFIRATIPINAEARTTIGIIVLFTLQVLPTFLLINTLFDIVSLGRDWRSATGQQGLKPIPKRQSLPPPDLVRPPVYALAPGANLQPLDLDALHPRRVLQPDVTGHATGVGSLLWNEL